MEPLQRIKVFASFFKKKRLFFFDKKRTASGDRGKQKTFIFWCGVT